MIGAWLNKRLGLFLGISILSIFPALAQEVNAVVQVVAPRVQIANKEILNTLQMSLQQFINNRKWTEEAFNSNEKVNMSLFINIDNWENDKFQGTAQLQITRPVYGSTYKTTVMQFNDEDVGFSYREFENLEYQENMNMNDLSTLMAYYVYVSLGIELDSYGALGGSKYLSLAQNIVNLMTNKPGWNQGDGKGFRNRFYLAENLNSPRFKEFRELSYEFHRGGLDIFHEDPSKGRKKITEALQKISETAQSNRNSLLQKLFFTTKWPELVEIYQDASTAEKTIVLRLLKDLDPTNIQRYEKIKS
jgi:hypothetical protein